MAKTRLVKESINTQLQCQMPSFNRNYHLHVCRGTECFLPNVVLIGSTKFLGIIKGKSPKFVCHLINPADVSVNILELRALYSPKASLINY